MEVYLLRTSNTVGASDGGEVPESQRYLSAEGRQMVRAIGNKIRLTEEPSFDRVLVSPFPAAVQTAELFADRVDYVGVVEALPLLVAGTPPAVIVSLLLQRGERTLVVADEPVLATVGAFLVGRPTFPPAMPAQVSVIKDRKPEWCLRPGELGRQLLLVA